MPASPFSFLRRVSLGLCYINRGLILEEGIAHLLRGYLRDLNTKAKYPAFSVSVTTEHPFARLYLNDSLTANDAFPAIVVSTEEDKKPQEFTDVAPAITGIKIEEADIDELLKDRDTPGLCAVCDDETVEAIKGVCQRQGWCYGYKIASRHCDDLAVEVWAENVQLKNELYEELRLFISGNLDLLLTKLYPDFDTALFDHTVVGHRSNNYNYDFDVMLTGGHIAFSVNYCTAQYVFNTELTGFSGDRIIEEVIGEAKNYVK